MEIGERLKRARETRGLSKSQVAKFAGVAPATITRWEKGTRQPRPKHLEKVLKVLRISYEDLFNDNETTSTDIQVVLSANPALSPVEIDVIMRIVESKERELRGKNKPEE